MSPLLLHISRGSTQRENQHVRHRLFASTFSPPPQSTAWRLTILTRAECSQLISLLLGKPLRMEQLTKTCASETGDYGLPTCLQTNSTTGICGRKISLNNYPSFSPLLPRSVREIWEWAPKSSWAPSVRLSATLARCSNWLASETRAKLKDPPSST
jgi:hypothetical protein